MTKRRKSMKSDGGRRSKSAQLFSLGGLTTGRRGRKTPNADRYANRALRNHVRVDRHAYLASLQGPRVVVIQKVLGTSDAPINAKYWSDRNMWQLGLLHEVRLDEQIFVEIGSDFTELVRNAMKRLRRRWREQENG